MAKPITTEPQKEIISTVPTIGLPKFLMMMSRRVTTIMKASADPAITWKVTSILKTVSRKRFIVPPPNFLIP
jgi:hypothetical protein